LGVAAVRVAEPGVAVIKFMGFAPGVSLRPFNARIRPAGHFVASFVSKVKVPTICREEFVETV